jgi:hypothetical protein
MIRKEKEVGIQEIGRLRKQFINSISKDLIRPKPKNIEEELRKRMLKELKEGKLKISED